MKFGVLALVLLLMPVAATAAVIEYEVTGKLDAVEYDFGEPASDAFLAETPLGTAYKLNFSYDTNSPALYSSPERAWYPMIAQTTFLLDGQDFTLAFTDVIIDSGYGPYGLGTRFATFGNFALSSKRLNGFYPIDLSLVLDDFDGTAIPVPYLPTSLNLEEFEHSKLRIRFGGRGETGLLFSITALTGGSPQAVPEPSTWALMVIGFGISGGIMRRQRTPSGRVAHGV
jgi:hypothetical protein